MNAATTPKTIRKIMWPGGEADIFEKIHALSEYVETNEVPSLNALGHELLEGACPHTTVRAHDGQARQSGHDGHEFFSQSFLPPTRSVRRSLRLRSLWGTGRERSRSTQGSPTFISNLRDASPVFCTKRTPFSFHAVTRATSASSPLCAVRGM